MDHLLFGATSAEGPNPPVPAGRPSRTRTRAMEVRASELVRNMAGSRRLVNERRSGRAPGRPLRLASRVFRAADFVRLNDEALRRRTDPTEGIARDQREHRASGWAQQITAIGRHHE